MDTTTREFQIPVTNMAELEKKVARLVRRSEKLGCGPIVLTKIADAQRKLKRARIMDIAVVEVSGPAPKIPGWTFGGTLEHVALEGGERMNLLRTIVEGVPEEYRTAKPWCFHCNVDRRWRDTFLVRHDESGEWKQVGRACIADFLGHKDAASLAEAAQWLRELDGFEFDEDGDEGAESFGGRVRECWELRVFLAHCYDAIAIEGWKSSKEDKSTAGYALSALNLPRDRTYEPPTHPAMLRGLEAIEWAADLSSDCNDFLWNIRAIALMGTVTFRTAGLAAAIACAYERELGRQVERKTAKAESKHFGTVGKRECFDLTVVRKFSYSTGYGDKTIVTMRDDDGNVCLWRASGVPDLDVGSRYTVKVTVKAHGEYKEVAQTEVQRLTVVVKHDQEAAVDGDQ